MDFKDKQEWIEALMADKNLTPATARYGFGIYKHMYGTKEESWPGAKALSESTGLNDSQFYKYNAALIDAGYIKVTSREGRSNHYRLTLPTSREGRYLPSEEVGVPPERVGPTSIEGTNTTSNTTSKTSREEYKGAVVASAPTASLNFEVKGRVEDSPNLETATNLPNREVSNAPTSIEGRSDQPWHIKRRELAALIEEDW